MNLEIERLLRRTLLLQKQIERLHQLPKTQQKIVMQMLDGVLAQASR